MSEATASEIAKKIDAFWWLFYFLFFSFSILNKNVKNSSGGFQLLNSWNVRRDAMSCNGLTFRMTGRKIQIEQVG